MKYILLTISALFILAGTAYGQDCPTRESMKPKPRPGRSPDAPAVCLEAYEMCNNWARHYCYEGSHERTVNEILRRKKERGVTITTAVIKAVAKRTLKN